MKKEVRYTSKAKKFLIKITTSDAIKIENKINQYAQDPDSLKNNVKKLSGVDLYRLRVGDYRVIFDEYLNIIEIIKIGFRGNIYDGLIKLKNKGK